MHAACKPTSKPTRRWENTGESDGQDGRGRPWRGTPEHVCAGRQPAGTRRQRFSDRYPGPGAPAADAALAGPRAGLEHGRLHQRLPGFAAGRLRPGPVARAPHAGSAADPLPASHQRGAGRHRRAGQPAGRDRPAAHGRWRVCAVVRQGSGRGPGRRCAQAWQCVRFLAARRRAGGGWRRPRLRLVIDAAPERFRHAGVEHAHRQSGQHRRIPGIWLVRLGAVALFRHVGGLQGHFRNGGKRRHGRPGRPAHALRPAGRLQRTGQRPALPLARPARPAHRDAPRAQAGRRARVRARQQHRPPAVPQPASRYRHRHLRQGPPRRARSAAPPGHQPRCAGARRRAPVQGGPELSARSAAPGAVQGGLAGNPRHRRKGAAGGAADPHPVLQLAGQRPPAGAGQARCRRRAAAAGAGRAASFAHRRHPGGLAGAAQAGARPPRPAARLRARRAAGECGRRRAAPALFLFRLPAQQLNQGAAGFARASGHRLPFHGLVDGPRYHGPDTDGRRRRRLGGPLHVQRHPARVPEPGRRHVFPLGLPGHPPGHRRARQHHLQDSVQRCGGHDGRPTHRRQPDRRRHRLASACRGRQGHRRSQRCAGKICGPARPLPAARHLPRARGTRPGAAPPARGQGRHRADLRPDLRGRVAPAPQEKGIGRSAAPHGHQQRRVRRLRRLRRAVELPVHRAAGNKLRPQARHRPVVVQQGLFLRQRLLPQLRLRARRRLAQGGRRRHRPASPAPRGSSPAPARAAWLARPVQPAGDGRGRHGRGDGGRARFHGRAP